MLGSYLLLDPITLGNMSIKELIGDNEWRSIGDAEIGSVKTASNGGIKMIIAYPIELDKDTFSGSIVVDDKQIINLGGYNYIVGDTGNACMEYKAHNGTIFKNLYNGKEYNTPKTDIRHFSLTEDSLITFSSSYDKKSVLMDLCILYDNYSVRDYGLYNNYPLQFHKYDQITLIDLKTDSEKIIKTRSGEKIIYLSNKKQYLSIKEIIYSMILRIGRIINLLMQMKSILMVATHLNPVEITFSFLTIIPENC